MMSAGLQSLISSTESDPQCTSSNETVAADSSSVELPTLARVAGGDAYSPSVLATQSSRMFWSSPSDTEISTTLRLPRVCISQVDRKRLDAIVKLLKCEDAVTILECCEVFSNELLQDFPVNVFFQESCILEAFINLTLNCLKSINLVELSIHTLRTIRKILHKLTVQLHECQDVNMVTYSDEIPDEKESRPQWSVAEVCWACLSTSAQCIQQSDCSAVLGEALALLRVSLAMHAAFFSHVSAEELSRLSLLLADIANSRPPGFAYLQVLLFIKKYVTQRPMSLKQSEILRNVLQSAILNAGIWCLNPDLVHDFLRLLDDLPEDQKFCTLVGGVTKMCQAITSSQKLLKLCHNNMNEQTMKEALVSLDFLPRPHVVRAAVETLCRAQNWQTSTAVLTLLAHSNEDMQAEAYYYCHQVVLACVGVGQARDPITYTPSHISFLCDDKVMQEITCFGLEHENLKVQASAENILAHLIKCRFLVPSTLWSKICSCLAFLMPLLVSKINSRRALREAIMSFLSLENQSIDLFQSARGNSCLLFSTNESIRIEAATRVLAIIDKHPQSYKKWPQKLSVHTSPAVMSSLCSVNDAFIFPKDSSEICYSESSLRQIVGLLGPDCFDPTVRHSALCQLAAMLHEPRLMPSFLDANGVTTCIQLLDQALSQDNVHVLSKSVKPIVTILCMVASSHSPSCQSLTQDETLLLNLIRAMFLYSSIDNDFRQHHSALLALLLFSDLLRHKTSTVSEERLVLPHQLFEGLLLPFVASSYGRVSSHTPTNHWHYLRALVDGNSDNLSLLFRCHLTIDMLGSLAKPAEVERAGHLNKIEIQQLLQLDASSSLLIAFHLVQTATSHTQVLTALPVLESYLPCVKTDFLPWTETFTKFLTQPPATNEDAILLKAIVILISEHGDMTWLPWHEIVSKLDPWQPSTLHTFLPLLLRSVEHLEQSVISRTTVSLCRCLVAYEATYDNSILRNILKCLSNIARMHCIQISSRLMAEIMAPLMDIVGRFSTSDVSYINLGIVEEALSCLCLVQANNLKVFAHHFLVHSETCDIFRVMLQIISSKETLCKASVLSILAGLTSCNSMKNNTTDVAMYIKQSIGLVLDKNEANLVKHQAVVFLSSVIGTSDCNVESFIHLLSESQWFDHVCQLWKDLFLNEKCTVALHIGKVTSQSPVNAMKPIITPKYLAAHYSFLYNLNIAAPLIVMMKIKEHGVFVQVLWSLTTCLEYTDNINQAICELIIETSNLLAYCLITDEADELAKELHSFPYIAPQLINVLKIPDFPQVASAVFWLMLTMEQAGFGALFVSAFHQGQFWHPLLEALQAPEAERVSLLLTRALALQTDASCQTFSSEETATTAGCIKVCKVLLQKLQREETHQAAMAALAGLLAKCSKAKQSVLKQGLLENIIVALNHCNTLLLTERDPKQLACTEKQVHPIVEEIIDSFELLVGFLLNDVSIKKITSATTLAEEVHKVWSICLLNSRLCIAAVKLLAVYTADCEQACTSLLLRQHSVGGVRVKRCASSTSLYHQLAQLVSTELNKTSSSTVCLALRVLRQSCLSVECRATLAKTSLLQDIFLAHGGFERLIPETKVAVLNLISNFTRQSEGQLAVARIPEAVESLCVVALDFKGDEEMNLLSTEILRNICFCHANRIIVLTSRTLVACFLQILDHGRPRLVQLVATAIWSMVANHHRNKQVLKVSGFQRALAKAKVRCDGDVDTISIIDSVLDNFTDSS